MRVASPYFLIYLSASDFLKYLVSCIFIGLIFVNSCFYYLSLKISFFFFGKFYFIMHFYVFISFKSCFYHWTFVGRKLIASFLSCSRHASNIQWGIPWMLSIYGKVENWGFGFPKVTKPCIHTPLAEASVDQS